MEESKGVPASLSFLHYTRKAMPEPPGLSALCFSHCLRLLGGKVAPPTGRKENNRSKQGGGHCNGWPLPRWQCLSEFHVLEGKKETKNLEEHLRMGGPPPEPHREARGWKRGSWLKTKQNRKQTNKKQIHRWTMRRNEAHGRLASWDLQYQEYGVC